MLIIDCFFCGMFVSHLHAVSFFQVGCDSLNTFCEQTQLCCIMVMLLFPNREKKKSKLDEFTNDFAKELMEYKKIQKERRRSYSR